MRIDIISGSNPASSARTVVPPQVEWPSGADVKRRISMLEEGHAKFRTDLNTHWNSYKTLTDKVQTLEANQEREVIFVEGTVYRQGWWYRFCRRWLLGI